MEESINQLRKEYGKKERVDWLLRSWQDLPRKDRTVTELTLLANRLKGSVILIYCDIIFSEQRDYLFTVYQVRDGNWNEDRFGCEILSTRKPVSVELLLKTEHSRSFINPRELPVDPRVAKVKLESMEAIRAKNKDGLSYSLLFQHGSKLQDPNERYRTTQQLSNASFQKFSIPDGTRSSTREKAMSREAADISLMTSTSRTADLRVNMSPPRSSSAKKRIEVDPSPLPRWNRRTRKI